MVIWCQGMILLNDDESQKIIIGVRVFNVNASKRLYSLSIE
jgi:hypothetical protein